MSRSTAKTRGAEPPATPADWTGRRLHFVGIGGCGMSGLAIAAQCRGATVSRSDQSDTSYLPRLRERGITVTIPHTRPWGSLRSQTLASAFGRALGLADAAIVLPHVGTVTEPFPGAATASLADTVRAAAPSSMVAAARDYHHGRDLVQPLLGPGTVCLVLGCGPVERFSPMLLRTGADDGQR